MSATPHGEVARVVAQFEARPESREVAAVLAAHSLEHGARNRITADAMLRRPGAKDARFRDIRIGYFAAPTAEAEQIVLTALAAMAARVGATLVVRAPGPGCANHVAEWLTSQGPAPMARWTIDSRLRVYDREGRAHEIVVTETAEAPDAWTARRVAGLRKHVPESMVLGGSSVSVGELDDAAPPLWAGDRDVLRSSLDRARLRALSAEGVSPIAMLTQQPPIDALDAMCALADAWCVQVTEVEPIGAWMRGERPAEEVDAALIALRALFEDDWLLRHRLAGAIARDQIDPVLAAQARRAGAIKVIEALMDVAGIGLADAKGLVGHLDGFDDAALTARGVLSRELARMPRRSP